MGLVVPCLSKLAYSYIIIPISEFVKYKIPILEFFVKYPQIRVENFVKNNESRPEGRLIKEDMIMSILPVSAETYFKDAAAVMDLIDVTIKRNGNILETTHGVKNRENGKKYIHLPINVDVQVGDGILIEEEDFTVIKIAYDTFNGERQLIKAFY